jgi:hypothetical protein
VLDLAARIVRNGYSPSPSEVERVTHALLAEQEELAELRDLVRDADISALPPELLAVRQRWLAGARQGSGRGRGGARRNVGFLERP